MLQVEVIETSELGDRSYIVHDGTTAVVVDPQRDIDRVEAILAAQRLTLAAVAETHIHNDYVTGGLALARSSGVDYLVSADDAVAFERHPVSDGDHLAYGGLRIAVIATPGHTHHHLAYAVSSADEPSAVFTGGSLLYGSVGRTDLVDAESTDALTRAQYRSAHRLAALVPDTTVVYPTHGFGSFCSVGATSTGAVSTVGEQRLTNDALVEPDEDAFVERLIANLTAYPAYYAHMGARNLAGPDAPDLTPAAPLDAAELRRRLDASEWVVDLRTRQLFAAAHLPGSVSIELGESFSTYIGWLLPWGVPITLVGATAAEVEEAQRQLVRIGIERPDAAAFGEISDLAAGREPASFRRVTFEEVKKRLDRMPDAGDGEDPFVLVDIRRDDERAEVGLIPEAVHVPIHEFIAGMDKLPAGTVWVHCATGFRASIAVSLLLRAGRSAALVDDKFGHARRLGIAAVPDEDGSTTRV